MAVKDQFLAFLTKPRAIYNYLLLISLPACGLAALLITKWINRGAIISGNWKVPLITYPVSHLFTIPLAFALWVYVMDRERPVARRFSVAACLISMMGFVASGHLRKYHAYDATLILALIGTCAGLCAFISLRDCWSRVKANRRLTAVAVAAASTGAVYNLLDGHLWQHICRSTATAVYWLLSNMGVDVGLRFIKKKHSVLLHSHDFTLQIYRACSGLEGIFIFLFMLSVLVIIDWRVFKRLHLLETYLIGFIYMFLANVLRIATLFAVAYHARKPDAGIFLKPLKEVPFEVFHSYTGMIYYLIAFALFAICIYRLATQLDAKEKEP